MSEAPRCARRPRARLLLPRFARLVISGAAAARPITYAAQQHDHREHRRASSALSDEHTTTAVPRRGGLLDEAVDVGLRPDVDALGRLVEHEHPRLQRNQRAMTTFCWLPPESSRSSALGSRRAHVELLDPLLGLGLLGRGAEPAPSARTA